MRLGLRSLLTRSAVEIAGEAENERNLLRMIGKSHPEVVLLDVSFSGGDGFATLEKIHRKHPDLPVIIWAVSENHTNEARAMALGASGYLSRGSGRTELLSTIRSAAATGDGWTKEQRQRYSGVPTLPENIGVSFTPREREVLRQLAFGLSNKDIAQALGISYETVKEHVQHILQKLKVNDRVKAAVWAVKQGIV